VRLFDLLDLFDGEGDAAVDSEGAIVLPGALSPDDKALVVTLARMRADGRLARLVEVTWEGGITEPSRRAVEARLDTFPDMLLRVDVGADVDLDSLSRSDAIRRSKRTVVCVAHPGGREPFGSVRELARRTVARADARVPDVAAAMGLDVRPWRVLRAFATGLSNPVSVAVLAEAALSLQIEGVAGDTLRLAALRRVLVRELAWRDDVEVAALLTIASEGIDRALSRWPRAVEGLRAQMLSRDGRVLDWAELLLDAEVARGVLDALFAERRGSEVLREVSSRGARSVVPSDPELAQISSLISQGRLADAERALDERIGLGATRPLDHHARWFGWMLKGRAARDAGRFDECLSALQTAAELAAAHGPEAEGMVRRALGQARAGHGEHARAEVHFREAVAFYETAGIAGLPLALLHHELGESLLEQGRFAEAESLLRAALAERTAAGDRAIGRTLSLRALSVALQKQARHGEAVALVREMLTLADEISDDPVNGSRMWRHAGMIFAKAGLLEESVDAFRKALSFGRGYDSDLEVAKSAEQLGRALAHLGALDDALASFDEALALMNRAAVSTREQNETLSDRCVVLTRLGRLDDAARAISELLEIEASQTTGPMSREAGVVADLIGHAFVTQERIEDAERLFTMALEHLAQDPTQARNAAVSAFNLASMSALRGAPTAVVTSAMARAYALAAALDPPFPELLERVAESYRPYALSAAPPPIVPHLPN
jgi:tetratricopeptide (TPR) repeat protein